MEKLDKGRYLQRIIIVIWIVLVICCIIKLFGDNFFEIACNNPNFIGICEYADNHFWAKYLIGAIYSFISLYFYILAICQKFKYTKYELIIVIVTVLAGTAIKLLNVTLGWIFDAWQFLILPFIIKPIEKKKILKILLAITLLLAFQLISMFIKNLGFGMITHNGVLISAIYSIDVIIMIILYYLYSNLIFLERR